MLKFVVLLSVVALAINAIPGGWVIVELDNEGVVAAANHAAKALSMQWDDNYHHRLAKIIKAQRQTVAGTNYKLDVIVGKTNCKKDEVKFEDAADCEFQDETSTYKKCETLVHRDLQGQHQLLSSDCVPASKNDL